MVPAFARLEVVFDHGARTYFAFAGEDDGWELEDRQPGPTRPSDVSDAPPTFRPGTLP